MHLAQTQAQNANQQTMKSLIYTDTNIPLKLAANSISSAESLDESDSQDPHSFGNNTKAQNNESEPPKKKKAHNNPSTLTDERMAKSQQLEEAKSAATSQ